MTRTVTAAVVAGLVCLAAAGCSSEPVEAPNPGASVIIPGKPGESAKVVPPAQAGEHQQRVAINEVDVTYVTMMIPHHRQALVMTELVPDRATSELVRGIADRISVAQGGEIDMMASWLTQNGKQVPPEDPAGGHAGHEHAAMAGMATPEQLEALRAAKGAEFDRMFLELMIRHHEGALTMAEEALANGLEVRAQEMAQDVVTGQTAEIERMRKALQPG